MAGLSAGDVRAAGDRHGRGGADRLLCGCAAAVEVALMEKIPTREQLEACVPGLPLRERFCSMVSCCEYCNRRVRFWCRVNSRIGEHQTKIIKKLLQ